MSSGWQEAAAQQAEEVSARLRQLLITGLGLLRSELGLELGLEPQRYPAWVFLAVPVSLGLFFLFVLLHCATSRSAPKSKRVSHHEKEPTVTRAPVPNKTVKVEEPKKKSKKKPPAEKAKPNGRPVELAEEVVIPAVKKESPKRPVEAEKKNEKATSPKASALPIKKNKKKPKADAKPTQSASQDKKEAEEGNWETKISNKEKRQQRRRDKGADGDAPDSPVVEAFTVISTQSINIRKSKGPSETSALNGGSWNEKPTKVIPSQIVEEKRVTASKTAVKKKAEPSTRIQDSVDANGKDWGTSWTERSLFPGIAAWPNVDPRLNSSEKRPPFSTIGLNNAISAAGSDSVPQTSVTDKQWEVTPKEPGVDDEWSGLNGLNSADPSSDWSAPAEEWGNYGEDEPSGPQTEEPEQEVPKVSDDDKEKDESGAQTSSKNKKKKKKKKKQGEESGSPTQEADGTRGTVDGFKEDSVPASKTPVIPTVVAKNNEQKEKKTVQEKRLHTVFTEAPVSVHEKNPVQAKQPQEDNTSVTKQNSVSPPSQAKSEESWESPKQVKKKKKARRET